MSSDKEGKFKTLFTELRQYLEINLEYARLTVAEKMAVLMTTAAMAMLVGVIAVLAFFFISIAAVHWLGLVMNIALAYSIMAGVYVLILVLLYVLRYQLLFNPISRFVTKLLMK